jgi:thioesterase domain-containing protein
MCPPTANSASSLAINDARAQLAADVTALLQSEIPLTKAIGFRISDWDGETVTLAAPLPPNINHADTAFGGSISTMAILAGYGLLYILLQERKLSTRILIQRSATEFVRPIDTEIVSTACCPAPAVLEEFLETLKRKRRAKLAIESKVLSSKAVGATHTGLYVAMIY